MKKYFNMLLFIAVALFGVVTMVSCSKDDDTPAVPEEKPVVKNYARYTAKFSEDIFKFYEINVIIESDSKKDVYKFDESTKVSDIKHEFTDFISDEYDKPANKAGRVLEIPTFEFGLHPLTIKTEMVLTEAGKKLIATPTTDEIDFVAILDFGECDAQGHFIYPSRHIEDPAGYGGLSINELEGFMDTYMQYHAKNYNVTFK